MRDRMKSQNQHPRPAPPARRTSKNRRSKKKGNQKKKKKKAKLDPRATFLKRTKLPYMRTYSFRFHFDSNYRHRHNYQQTQKKQKVKNSRQWEVEETLHKITKISSDSSKTFSSPLNNDRLLLWPRPVNETTSQSVFERKKERNRSNRMHGSAIPRFHHFPRSQTKGKKRKKKAREKKTNKAERYALQPKYPRGQSSRPHWRTNFVTTRQAACRQAMQQPS